MSVASPQPSPEAAAAIDACEQILTPEGRRSPVGIARRALDLYRRLPTGEREAFLRTLLVDFGPDTGAVDRAVDQYRESRDGATLAALGTATEPRRLDVIRLLNTPHGATPDLVRMRGDLLELIRHHPELHPLDRDFVRVFRLWFNRGFLTLRQIDWTTPAIVLEKLIAYEAVHEVRGWPDLRRRLMSDRRCFAYFHPGLGDDPVIFVEVALEQGMSDSIQSILQAPPPGNDSVCSPTTAIFYSITNCHPGLAGVTTFGGHLLKQVVDHLSAEFYDIGRFATLSPVPGFLRWLHRRIDEHPLAWIPEDARRRLAALDDPSWVDFDEMVTVLRPVLMRACAVYLLETSASGRPIDPVARFHTGNGAWLERINWMGDSSVNGLSQSAGIMVNYVYQTAGDALNGSDSGPWFSETVRRLAAGE